MEVVAMSLLVFLVLTELSPSVSILVLSGVFMVQTFIDAYTAFRKCRDDNKCPMQGRRRGYDEVGEANHQEGQPFMNQEEEGETKRYVRVLQRLHSISENYVVKVFATLLQLLGVFGISSFFIYMMVKGSAKGEVDYIYMRPVISLPFVLLILSMIWSNRFQEAIARPDRKTTDQQKRTTKTSREEHKKSIITARYKSSKLLF